VANALHIHRDSFTCGSELPSGADKQTFVITINKPALLCETYDVNLPTNNVRGVLSVFPPDTDKVEVEYVEAVLSHLRAVGLVVPFMYPLRRLAIEVSFLFVKL